MAQSDGTQKYDVSIFVDKEMFDRQMAEVNAKFNKLGKTAENAGDGIDRTFKKIGAGVAAYFAVGQIQSFVKEVVNVRSEFQKLEVSFTSLLGSAEKGKKMFSDITAFATSTPLLEKDLASAAQTLLGFNIEAEKVMPLLQQIGDVSMGDAQKFQSLTLAFAQASSTGKLMGQDLLQMINAGFNPLSEIARTTGRSMSELKDEMSKGNITVEMLEGAFRSATSEGGKFNGMLEAQSKTLAGAMSNLEGAVQKLMNDIGEGIEEPIVNGTNKAIEAVNWLAEDLENVERAVQALIVTFGAYKAGCLLVASGMTSLTMAEALHYNWLVLMEKAQKLLNATMLKNPYVLAAVAIGTLVASVIDYVQQANKADEATKRLNDSSEKFEAEAAKERAEIDKLFADLKNAKEGTDEYKKAKDAIISQYGNYLKGLDDEVRSLKNVEAAYIAITKAARESAKARAMQGALGAAQEEYGKNYSENMNPLSNYLNYYDQKHGGDEGSKLLNMVKEQLSKTGKVALKTQNDIRNLLKNTPGFSESANWFANLEQGEKRLRFETQRANELFAPETKDDVEVEEKKWSVEIAEKREQLKQKERELADLKKSGTTKQVNAKQKEIDDLKKDLKENGYNTDKEASNANKAATAATRANKEDAQRQQKYADVILKQEEELAKKRSQLELQTEQARIDQMADGSKKTIRQIELDYQKELAAIELAEDDMLREQTEMARKRWEAQNSDKTKTWENAGWHQWQNETGGAKLSSEQQALLDEREKAAKAAHDRALEAQQNADRQYMLDYLKEYGSMEQQRLAIVEETERKVAELRKNGASEFEIANVQEESKKRLKEVDATDIFNKIDWSNVFSDLASHTKEYLVGVRDQLQELINNGSLKSIEDIEKVQERLDALNAEIGKNGGLFSFEGERAREHNRLASNAEIAQGNRQAALKEEANAFNALARLQDAGAGADKLAVAEARLAKARENVKKATEKARSAEDAARRTSAQAIADWFADAEQFIAEKGIDQLPGLMDKLGLGSAGDKLGKGLSGFNNAAGAAADFMKHNYIGAAMKGISAIADFGSALGIGNGDSDKTYAEDMERLSASNEALRDSIDNLSSTIKDKNTSDAISDYRKIFESIRQEEKNSREQLERSGKAYSDGFLGIGGSHSSNYRIDDKMTASEWKKVSAAAGVTVKSASDFWKLTSEQMWKVATYESTLYSKIKEHADEGKENAAQYMDEYIGYWEELKNKQKEYYEYLTGMSFDSMRSNFKDELMDMDNDVEDFADNMVSKMTDAILEIALNTKGGVFDQLESLYNELGKKLEEANGDVEKISDEWMDNWIERYKGITEAGFEVRNKVLGKTHYSQSDSQSATANSIKNLTADQGDQIVGRITAMQIAVERSTMFAEELTANAKDMATKITTGLSLIEENNSLTQRCAQHLESISEYTSVLPYMSDELSKLRTITEQRL